MVHPIVCVQGDCEADERRRGGWLGVSGCVVGSVEGWMVDGGGLRNLRNLRECLKLSLSPP